MEKIRQTIRKDGLRIITKKLSYTKKVMFSVTSLMGSVYDTNKHLGVAHFIEHAVHQGTKTRNWEQIRRDLDNFCCTEVSADTHYLRTRYYGISAKMYFQKMVEVILDIYCNPIFPDDRIENEKGIVISEMMIDDNDLEKASNGLCDLLYGVDNLVSRKILGDKETVSRIDRSLLVALHKKYYAPANSVVIATGDVSHKEVVEMVNNYFPLGEATAPVKIRHWEDQSDRLPYKHIACVRENSRKTAILYAGCKLKNFPDAKYIFTARILTNIMRNMLFDELRQKRGLVYDTSAGIEEIPPFCNVVYCYTENDVSDLDKVKDMMFKVMLDLPLSENSFLDIKQQFLAGYSIYLETLEEWSEAVLDWVLKDKDIFGLEHFFKDVSQILSQIKFEDVLNFRLKYFTKDRLALFIINK